MELHNNKSINKVADVTIFFWIIKIISTTIGETTADFFKHTFGFSPSIVVGIILGLMIFIQIKFKRYVPWMYWGVIVCIAIFGTMFADFLSDDLHISLLITSTLFLTLLLIAFVIWYKIEKSLDAHDITTTRKEIFYWIVIFFTFALGTAAGDFMSDSLHLGYMNATAIFGIVMIAIPFLLYMLKINNIALFWISYILTRPFGAAGGDLLSHPVRRGGFGFGNGTTSLSVSAIMLALIVYLTITHKKEIAMEEGI